MPTQKPPALAALKARARETTQAALAREIGVSAPQMSDWLAGISRPSAANRERIATLFAEIPTSSWLLRRERPTAPRNTASRRSRPQGDRTVSATRGRLPSAQVST